MVLPNPYAESQISNLPNVAASAVKAIAVISSSPERRFQAK